MMELKKIKILSLAKIAGLFGVIYGLLSGIFVSIIYAGKGSIPGLTEELGVVVNQLGYFSLIILPVLNGAIYFLAGMIIAFLYNLIAKNISGIQIELVDKKKK